MKNQRKYIIFWIGVLILSIFMAVSCHAQTTDTIPVVILVCDTSNVHYDRVAFWAKGYSVRELYNTSKGVSDARGRICIDPVTGRRISCYHDYWKHIKLLDQFKNEIGKNIIVWDFKEIEP